MAFRLERPAEGVPERLARFVASEWPGHHCAREQLEVWSLACAEWLAADTDRQPAPGRESVWWLAGGSRRRLPFGKHGGALDLIRETARLKRTLPLCVNEFRPGSYRGPRGSW